MSSPPAGSRRARWPSTALLVSCGLVAAGKLWLAAGGELVARANPLDQVRYLEMAAHIADGEWLGPYGVRTLIREPGYPLWVAAVHGLGLPLRWAGEALLLGAAALFCAALRRAGLSAGLTAGCFALLVLEPHSLVVARDALPAGFYFPVLLLALAAWTAASAATGRWARGAASLAAGLALGVLWCTRPEKALLLGALAVGVGWEVAAVHGQGRGWRSALARGAVLGGLPLLGIALVAGPISLRNQQHYGVFGTTEVTAPGYLAANRALLSIQHGAPRRLVPVPEDVRARAYRVSPALRELRPTLEGPSWARAVSCRIDRVCDDIGAGYFRWLLREAAAAAGHMATAAEADAFFQRIADEIQAACASGALACRRPAASFLHPYAETYRGQLWRSFGRVARTAFLGPGVRQREPQGDDPEIGARIRRLFDEMAGREPAGAGAAERSGASLRRDVRALLWTVHPLVYAALSGLAVLGAASLVASRRWDALRDPLFGTLLWIAFLVAARLALLTLIDASSFPARSSRYVYAAVPLYGCAALLLAQLGGLGRRRGGAVG